MREEQEHLFEVPAEVDLGAGDLVLVVKGNDLGVPSPAAAGDVALIGDDYLVARLDQPDDIEVLAPPRPGPATLKVAVTIELRVGRGGEEEVIAQAVLEEAAVAGCKCDIGVANNLLAVGGDQPSLVSPPAERADTPASDPTTRRTTASNEASVRTRRSA
jgi:hypothetical protein